MYWYKVLVASQRYHGSDALTYESAESLERGHIVTVPLQRQTVVGVVIEKLARQPEFSTKPIGRLVSPATLPLELLDLINWLQSYYPSSFGALMQLLLPGSLAQTSRTPLTSKPHKATPLPPLTEEQTQAMKQIKAAGSEPILLHGDTGTGKTRVYLETARQQLEAGRSVIALTPEIGLTPQLATAFEQAFPAVVTLHSNLTPAERRKRWLKVLEATTPQVVVGPRSALFSPVRDLGLIIMDEAHDQAYKQEQQPYYQTSRVAAVLASRHNAQFIMGTATPLVADYYTFLAKQRPIIRLSQPAMTVPSETTIELVTLSEREHFTRSAYLSNQLLDNIASSLNKNEQSLVFLNRRGSARLVLCEQCGWTASCPRCDLALTYHGDAHHIRCHVCGYSEAAPSRCPHCGHTDIAYKSIGTKTLVAELERQFPEARIRRFDTDLKKDERLEAAYQTIHQGEVDILVGTQMLAKGLDLPRLGLVGVVVADTSLFIPDFSAEEHSYQLLSQIIGRVGRGHRHGMVIVQTYHPENTALQAAIRKDYQSFYEQQITERRLFRFPPFVFLLKLTLSRATPAAAKKAAFALEEKIRNLGLPIELTGPGPAFHERTHGKYHWQLIIKTKSRPHLLTIIESLPANVGYDIDPSSLL